MLHKYIINYFSKISIKFISFCQNIDFKYIFNDVFEYIKLRSPFCKIVVGGANAWKAEDEAFNNYVDFVVRGQSDSSVVALADHLFNDSKINVSLSPAFL